MALARRRRPGNNCARIASKGGGTASGAAGLYRTVLFHGKHAAGAAKARLDLVGNQHNVVLVANAAQLAQKARRVRVVAALALDGLDQNGARVLRAGLLRKGVGQGKRWG